MKQFRQFVILPIFLFLSGCSSFTGLRKPLYDGSPVESNEAAIEKYEASREIVGPEKDYYIRYPFSKDIHQESLGYPDEEPVLLEEGQYTIGEGVPAGRVSLLGNESVFTDENRVVHVGNMIIRDEAGEIYFENLFHSSYGQLAVQVDFIEGHTIEIIGSDPEITVFYAETFPKDPYVLMDPPQVLVNLERLVTPQPVTVDEETGNVQLTAGIYEVGAHIEPGLYEIKTVIAPHATEMFLFREGEEVRVFELLPTEVVFLEDGTVVEKDSDDLPQIELIEGDKLFPSLVSQFELLRVK